MSLCPTSAPVAGHCNDEEHFYINCRAAYLALFKSSLSNIVSKEELCRVLQQAGRNPSFEALNKYWTPRTTKLTFDDFYEILKQEKPSEKQELMRAFKKLDVNGAGYISHRHLKRILTTAGEKMDSEELTKIFALTDINKDGKFDYTEFCRLLLSTVDKCQKVALQRLEADTKLKQQNFGNQSASPPVSSVMTARTPPLKPPLQKEPGSSMGKADSRPTSRSSSTRSRRSSVSSGRSTGSYRADGSKVLEPKDLTDWHHSHLKGCFFLAEDGGMVSLQYHLHVPQTCRIVLTICPLNINQKQETMFSGSSVDTSLFVVSEEDMDESNLVCFTESQDKQGVVWKGELDAGRYLLLPFTSCCWLRRKARKPDPSPVQLVHRSDSGEVNLTREFRAVLSDIFDIIDLDGDGLLSLEEYNLFELRTTGEMCDDDAWAMCRENFDTKKNALTRQGFIELNLMEAKEREGDPRDLWVTLEAMGYNQGLDMVNACPFIIDVYCEAGQAPLQALNLESSRRRLNLALQRSIIDRGEVQPIKGHEKVLVYTYRGEGRVSSLIANKSNKSVVVHVNTKMSRNCISSRGMSVFAVEVPARTRMVCQHVLPIDNSQEWTYSCVERIVM